jgi:hypothetical protein
VDHVLLARAFPRALHAAPSLLTEGLACLVSNRYSVRRNAAEALGPERRLLEQMTVAHARPLLTPGPGIARGALTWDAHVLAALAIERLRLKHEQQGRGGSIIERLTRVLAGTELRVASGEQGRRAFDIAFREEFSEAWYDVTMDLLKLILQTTPAELRHRRLEATVWDLGAAPSGVAASA